MGETLDEAAGDLCQSVVDRLKGDSGAEKALAEARANPDSVIKQTALQAAITGKMEDDADFAEQIEKLVNAIQKKSASSAFDQRDQTVNGPQTNIARDQYNNYYQKLEKYPVPHQIPTPPRNFTGREDIIEKILSGFSQGSTSIGLCGVGGLGKTALAYRLAELLRDRYKGGQLKVDLRGTAVNPFTPSQAMSEMLRYYYPTAKLPESQEELQSLYLSTLHGKNALMLLDNVRDDQQIWPLLPVPADCGMIITSRCKLENSEIVPIDLEVLKEDEAMALLIKTARPHAPAITPEEKTAWKEIAKLCGYLPVALQAAGSYLARTPGSTPKKYISELQDESKRLKAIGKMGVQEDVLTKFNLSYSRLEPETAKVFRRLSIFPADFFSQAEEAVCQDEGHQKLIELVRWSLAEYQRSDGESEGRYHLHDLLRLFASEKLSEEDGNDARDEARQRHAEHFRDVLYLATELYKKGNVLAGLNAFDLERMNIESAWAWARENLDKSNAAASICSSFLNWPYLLELRQHPRERISWTETALSAARKLNDRSMEASHLGNLSNAYVLLGDARMAIEYCEQALPILREIRDKRGEGAALGNLGLAYYSVSDFHKAINYYEQALAIAHKIGDRRGEGGWLGNLGLAYADLGDALKAIEYYELSLTIAYDIGDRRGEGKVLGNLGLAYTAFGGTRKAIEYHEQHLAIAREIGDRRGEGNALGNLGLAYAALGDARKAIECYEQALPILREIGDRRGEGSDLGNLGNAYAALGDACKAIEYYEQQLAISREIGYRRSEGNALGNLGSAYRILGDAQKAIECFDQSLFIAREIGNRRGEGSVLGNQGLAYVVLGEARKAIDHYKKSLAILQEIGDRKGEGTVLVNLGSAFCSLGEIAPALNHYQQALMIAQEIGDRNGEANSLWGQAICSKRMNDPEKAIAKAESALRLFELIESPSASTMRELLAEWKK